MELPFADDTERRNYYFFLLSFIYTYILGSLIKVKKSDY